ncbi:hypothetical protein MRX96_026339 [Rhipicephalus microplus]
MKAGPGPLSEWPWGDLHMMQSLLMLLADSAAPSHVSNVLAQSRPTWDLATTISVFSTPGCPACSNCRTLDWILCGIITLEPQSRQPCSKLSGLVAVGHSHQLLPSGYCLGHLGQDWVSTGRLRHSRPGDYLVVCML